MLVQSAGEFWMTLNRAANPIEESLALVLKRLCDDDARLATGVGLDALRKVSHPDKGRSLFVAEAIGLDALLETLGREAVFGPLFAALVARKVAELGGKTRAALSPHVAFARVQREMAEAELAVYHFLDADGGREACTKATRELQDLIDWATKLRDLIEPGGDPTPTVTPFNRSGAGQ